MLDFFLGGFEIRNTLILDFFAHNSMADEKGLAMEAQQCYDGWLNEVDPFESGDEAIPEEDTEMEIEMDGDETASEVTRKTPKRSPQLSPDVMDSAEEIAFASPLTPQDIAFASPLSAPDPELVLTPEEDDGRRRKRRRVSMSPTIPPSPTIPLSPAKEDVATPLAPVDSEIELEGFPPRDDVSESVTICMDRDSVTVEAESASEELEFEQEIELSDEEEERRASERMSEKVSEVAPSEGFIELDIDDTLELELELDVDGMEEKEIPEVEEQDGEVDVEELEVDDIDDAEKNEDQVSIATDEFQGVVRSDSPVTTGSGTTATRPYPRIRSTPKENRDTPDNRAENRETRTKKKVAKRKLEVSEDDSDTLPHLPHKTRKSDSPMHSASASSTPKGMELTSRARLRKYLQAICSNYPDTIREMSVSLGIASSLPRAKLSFPLKGSQRPSVVEELSKAGFQSAASLAEEPRPEQPEPKDEIKRPVARSAPLELLRKYTLDGEFSAYIDGNVMFVRGGIMYPGKTLLPLTDGDSKTCVTLAQMWLLATLGEEYKSVDVFQEFGIKSLTNSATALHAYITGATDRCRFASTPVIAVSANSIPDGFKEQIEKQYVALALRNPKLKSSGLKVKSPRKESPETKQALPASKAHALPASKAAMMQKSSKAPPPPRGTEDGPRKGASSSAQSKAHLTQTMTKHRKQKVDQFVKLMNYETEAIVQLALLKMQMSNVEARRKHLENLGRQKIHPGVVAFNPSVNYWDVY